MKALSVDLTRSATAGVPSASSIPFVKDDSISRKRVSRFLRDDAGKGYEAVNIHGGEATIRRDLLDILDEIRELGYPTVFLQTNRKMGRMAYAGSWWNEA